MNKAKEISALWEQIKPQIDEMVHLCYEVESHYEVTADAYQRGYEEGYKDGYNEPGKGKIQVGDEVTLKCGVRPAIYMQGTKGSDEIYLLFNDGSCGLHSKSEIERKTGRHFPEIVSVLEKMRGEKDG